MGQQLNKPNNDTFNSIGKPDRVSERGQENQAQEFINETDKEGAPSTAERGKQPRVDNKNKN